MSLKPQSSHATHPIQSMSVSNALDAIVAGMQKKSAMRQREIVFPNAPVIAERLFERIGDRLTHPDGRPVIEHAIRTALDWAMVRQLQSEPEIVREGHVAFVAGLLHPIAAVAHIRFIAGPRHSWDLTSSGSLPAFLGRYANASIETVHRLDPLRDVDLLTLKTMTASRILTAGDVAAMGGSIQSIVTWSPDHDIP
jgi:hypothetical protein